jgi:phage-related protein
VTWTVTFYSSTVEAEVLALSAGFVARFVRYAERMEVYGPDLGMPHTRAMGDGLFELRLKAAERIACVFYCTVLGHRIVILHQFVKKTEKTLRKELEVARRRLKEIKDVQLSATFQAPGFGQAGREGSL